MQQCHFCNSDLTSFGGQKYKPASTLYHCPICGEVKLKEEASEDFESERFSENQKKILSIVFRNEYERRYRKPSESPATLEDLHRYVRGYRPLSSLEKLDHCLFYH
jgi:hypothetical protein